MIRAYEPADWQGVWAVLEPVFRAGETFRHPRLGDVDALVMFKTLA
ncbi:hypothetical protein [Synechococcus sp. BA-132 BA5]|nr:hypothetical protein [Synechococcus sp. BA-132 BA5]MEA5416921.1 hypothetical protein [Synechococcus sp. BA-132 BA5]